MTSFVNRYLNNPLGGDLFENPHSKELYEIEAIMGGNNQGYGGFRIAHATADSKKGAEQWRRLFKEKYNPRKNSDFKNVKVFARKLI